MASAGAIFAAASAGVLLLSLKEEGTGMYQGNLPAADEPAPPGLKKATFGAGCFWCSEAVFRRLKGVHSVVPGYSGGRTNDPSYEEVCSGTTGHAEVVQVAYDPAVVSYSELLEVFWRTHDPTTPNRQGNDVGTQYRSVIFYHDDEQRQLAERYKEELNREGVFGRPIVTEIVPFRESYPAEEYHHNFYERNPRQPYCRFVIGPKLEKLREVFADKLQPKAAAGT
jgi:peptide-methionine (S)-S-oxide reductase